jgi:hypothetical protein
MARVYDRGMIVLRRARTDEAPALGRLQERASVAALAHVFPPDRYPFPRDAIAERWRRAVTDDAAHVVVAESDGEFVGVACARRECLEGST